MEAGFKDFTARCELKGLDKAQQAIGASFTGDLYMNTHAHMIIHIYAYLNIITYVTISIYIIIYYVHIYIHMCIRNKLRIEPENIMIYLCVDGLKGWSSSSSIPTIRVQKICNERGAACIKVFKVGLISIANILFHIFIHIYTW